VISEAGIAMDKQKVQAVLDWPMLRSVRGAGIPRPRRLLPPLHTQLQRHRRPADKVAAQGRLQVVTGGGRRVPGTTTHADKSVGLATVGVQSRLHHRVRRLGVGLQHGAAPGGWVGGILQLPNCATPCQTHRLRARADWVGPGGAPLASVYFGPRVHRRGASASR
jgi:hypothetical protein